VIDINQERLMLRVLDMYYNKELSQEVIAKKFHISRSTVSRLISKAKKQGYVSIHINYPVNNCIELEEKFEGKFHLEEAIILNATSTEFSDMVVPRAAAEYLLRIIDDDMYISMSWGTTLRKTVDNIAALMPGVKRIFKGVKIIPLLGSPKMTLNIDAQLNYSNELVERLGKILNSASYNLSAPMIVENKTVKGVLESEKQISDILNMAKKADVAIVGIGSVDEKSSPLFSGLITKEEQKKLLSLGIVGEIAFHYYNESGDIISTEFDDRCIGLKIGEILNIPLRVGIAYGEKKIKSIRAALKGKLINVIITDSITAEKILKEG
jgi:deoxyribonucleoside regulator